MPSIYVKCAAVFWLISVGIGGAIILRHQLKPGPDVTAPVGWPANASIQPESGRATLVLFAHPRCPCTAATLHELNRLLTRTGDALSPHIVFLQPADAGAAWGKTSSYAAAMALPGAKVHHDLDGGQARLFGARTSGTVVLYDKLGRLIFSGGITSSRGHQGDNLGSAVIAACRMDGNDAAQHTPVFGCPLFAAN